MALIYYSQCKDLLRFIPSTNISKCFILVYLSRNPFCKEKNINLCYSYKTLTSKYLFNNIANFVLMNNFLSILNFYHQCGVGVVPLFFFSTDLGSIPNTVSFIFMLDVILRSFLSYKINTGSFRSQSSSVTKCHKSCIFGRRRSQTL